jgi:hypothetical protein
MNTFRVRQDTICQTHDIPSRQTHPAASSYMED